MVRINPLTGGWDGETMAPTGQGEAPEIGRSHVGIAVLLGLVIEFEFNGN